MTQPAVLSPREGKRNVVLMLVIAFLQGHAFYTALITVHRQSFGLTLSVITSMEAAHTVLMLLLVLPWGIFADRFGYKRTLLFCNGLYALSKLCFLFAEGYFLFLMERLLRAAAISGLSSCNSAFLFLSVGSEKGRKVFSYYTAANAAGVFVSAAALPLVLKNDVPLASACATVYFLAAFALTFCLKDVRPQLGADRRTLKSSLKGVARVLSRERRFALFLVAAALLEESANLVAMVYNQSFYARAGIPSEWYGYLYSLARGLSMCAALSPLFVRRFGERRSTSMLFLTATACCAVLVVTRSAVLTVAAAGVLRAASGMFSPAKMTIQNRVITVQERTTMLAAFYMVSRAGMALVDLGAGAAVKAGLWAGALLLAVFCLLGFGLYWLWSAGKNRPDQTSQT